jgi:hypothetical protein
VPAAKSVVDELMAGKLHALHLPADPGLRASRRQSQIGQTRDLSKALHSMTTQTVVGPLTWDKKGDIVDPKYVFFYIWKNSTYAEMETTLRRQATASPVPGSAVDVGRVQGLCCRRGRSEHRSMNQPGTSAQ